MGTNFYRIPTEAEILARKQKLIEDINTLDLSASSVEDGFRVDVEDSWERTSWWEDILDLAYEVFKSPTVVQEFFNSGKEGELIHTLPNERIEKTLVNMANVAGVIVDEDTYPDLIRFKNC